MSTPSSLSRMICRYVRPPFSVLRAYVRYTTSRLPIIRSGTTKAQRCSRACPALFSLTHGRPPIISVARSYAIVLWARASSFKVHGITDPRFEPQPHAARPTVAPSYTIRRRVSKAPKIALFYFKTPRSDDLLTLALQASQQQRSPRRTTKVRAFRRLPRADQPSTTTMRPNAGRPLQYHLHNKWRGW